jgi:hypothetical protein
VFWVSFIEFGLKCIFSDFGDVTATNGTSDSVGIYGEEDSEEVG